MRYRYPLIPPNLLNLCREKKKSFHNAWCIFLKLAQKISTLDSKWERETNQLDMHTWSKPISFSKTWILTICFLFPWKSTNPGSGDLGHIKGFDVKDTVEELYSPSIWNFYNNEQMQWLWLQSKKSETWLLVSWKLETCEMG